MTIKRTMKFDCGRTVLRIVTTNRNSMYLLIIWRLGKSDNIFTMLRVLCIINFVYLQK